MTPSETYDTLVRQQEGCVLHPYLDKKGVPTIGIGTTIYPTGKSVTMADPAITMEQAEEYLNYGSAGAEHAVNAFVKSEINQNQFDALCDFVYNVGPPHFITSTLLRLINANPADPNITAAFLMWDKITVDGQLQVLDDLVNRRKAEAALYFS